MQDKQEEEELGPGDKWIGVFHYHKDPMKTHGIPFRFLVKEVGTRNGGSRPSSFFVDHITSVTAQGEMFSETKKRLFPRMGLNDKDFAKVKFTVVGQIGRAVGLEDGDILCDKIQSQHDHLGADHLDKSGKSSGFRTFEKAIKIFVSIFGTFSGGRNVATRRLSYSRIIELRTARSLTDSDVGKENPCGLELRRYPFNIILQCFCFLFCEFPFCMQDGMGETECVYKIFLLVT